MPPESTYSVLLVDDHQMVRLGLGALIASQSSLKIRLLEASNLDDAMTLYAQETAIDLVLLDLNLPDSQGLQSVRRFLARFAKAQIAIFSATEDDSIVRHAMALGAIGFVPKSVQASVSLQVLETLLQGGASWQSAQPQTFAPTLPSLGETGAPSVRERRARLTPGQLEVLELVLAGMSNQQIANECKLALGTVKNTVSSIFLQLDVTSRSHLISLFR